MTNRMQDAIRVPLTVAQNTRLQRLVAAAAAASAQRDEVLSALVEGVTDESMQGWNIQIKEREIILTAPLSVENGQALAPADAMSP